MTLFGSLILTNLLIALMTSKYEDVQEQATKQVIHTRTELTSQLKSGTRLMPPPLNIIVFLISIAVDIINLFLALIYPPLNIYRLISAQLFFNLQNVDVFQGFGHWKWLGDNKWQSIKGSESLFTTRKDVLAWYFIAPFYRFGEAKRGSAGKAWKCFHKACYGVLLLESKGSNARDKLSERVKGITMSKYCHRFERNSGQKIEHKDKQLLKQLSTNTLFCQYCCRPFLKENVSRELTTAYTGFLDLISVILFLIVLWIPMTICLFAVALVTWFAGLFEGTNGGDGEDEYKASDYDKEV